jgi:hypothetical protein
MKWKQKLWFRIKRRWCCRRPFLHASAVGDNCHSILLRHLTLRENPPGSDTSDRSCQQPVSWKMGPLSFRDPRNPIKRQLEGFFFPGGFYSPCATCSLAWIFNSWPSVLLRRDGCRRNRMWRIYHTSRSSSHCRSTTKINIRRRIPIIEPLILCSDDCGPAGRPSGSGLLAPSNGSMQMATAATKCCDRQQLSIGSVNG